MVQEWNQSNATREAENDSRLFNDVKHPVHTCWEGRYINKVLLTYLLTVPLERFLHFFAFLILFKP